MNTITEQFILSARKYIALIDNLDNTTPYQFLSECAILLPIIYSYGLQLPDTEPNDNEDDFKFESPMNKILSFLGGFHFYEKILEEFGDEGLDFVTLDDDLADIYIDLKRPLLNFDKNEIDTAIWEWKFNIQGHCGNHIVEALQIIHQVVNSHTLYED